VVGYLGILSNGKDAYSLYIIKSGKSIKTNVQLWYYQIISDLIKLISVIKIILRKRLLTLKKGKKSFTINGIKPQI